MKRRSPWQRFGALGALLVGLATIQGCAVEEPADEQTAGEEAVEEGPSALLPGCSKGLEVWVQPLEARIAYKELLGRRADAADLRGLLDVGRG